MRSARILVADPSPVVRERLVSALVGRIAEASIREASTLKGLMEALGSFAPEVLLLDPRLEGDAGGDIISAVKGVTPACGIVVLAWGSSDYAARCVAKGAHCVVDNAEPDTVITRVEEALAAARAGAASQDAPTARAIA